MNPESEEACLYLARSYAAEKLYKEAHTLLNGCEKRAFDNPVFSFLKEGLSTTEAIRRSKDLF